MWYIFGLIGLLLTNAADVFAVECHTRNATAIPPGSGIAAKVSIDNREVRISSSQVRLVPVETLIESKEYARIDNLSCPAQNIHSCEVKVVKSFRSTDPKVMVIVKNQAAEVVCQILCHKGKYLLDDEPYEGYVCHP